MFGNGGRWAWVTALAGAVAVIGCGDSKRNASTPDAGGAAGAGGADGTEAVEAACDPGCPVSQICSGERCVDIQCVPGHSFCAGQELRRCNDEGTDSELTEACDEGRFCVEQDGEAECRGQACLPGEAFCLNDQRAVCRADGSGPESDPEDCQENGQVCRDGACVAARCEPLTRSCQGDDVYVCDAHGAGLELLSECANGQTCDAELAECRQVRCEPGALGCDEDRVVSCNASGTGWAAVEEDCAPEGICLAGACHAKICTPGFEFCNENSVRTCDELGISSQLTDQCTSDEYCAPSSMRAEWANCLSKACKPNTQFCSLYDVRLCNAQGTDSTVLKTCNSPETCGGGECIARLCVGQRDCIGDEIAQCSIDGLSYNITHTCLESEHCERTSNGSAQCVADACVPGTKACLGNKVGTCGTDGLGLGSVTKDCAADNQVCVSAIACDSSAIDTLGEPEALLAIADGVFIGDRVVMRSHRSLHQIEADLVLPAARSLRWAVLEASNGDYTAHFDKVTAGSKGSGWYSSGNIDETLLDGHTYLIGVVVSGGASQARTDPAPYSGTASFGYLSSGESLDYAKLLEGIEFPTSGGPFRLRLTTGVN